MGNDGLDDKHFEPAIGIDAFLTLLPPHLIIGSARSMQKCHHEDDPIVPSRTRQLLSGCGRIPPRHRGELGRRVAPGRHWGRPFLDCQGPMDIVLKVQDPHDRKANVAFQMPHLEVVRVTA